MVESKDRLNKIINSFLEEIQKIYRIDNAFLYGSFAKGTFNKWRFYPWMQSV
jgi:predicted nucleotidyltransferase